MRRLIFILFVALICFSAKTETYLKIPIEKIKVINLVLKDQFSGTAIETYELDAASYEGFVADLNKAVEAPNMKLNTVCYRFDIVYEDGRKIQLGTNGKGIGPTPVGYFLSSENLILKYFPIKKERYCKPQNGGKGGGNIGF